MLGVAIANGYWQKLWTTLLVIGIAQFAFLAVVVSIGAAFVVKDLLVLLTRRNDDDQLRDN